MSRTVTALFDTRSEAEAAKARLTSSRIDADNIRIVDKQSSGSSGGSSSSGGGSSDAGNGQGFWGSLKDMFMPDEDRHAYGEGISRGGFMLCAQVDEDETDEAIRILDESNSVDFDKRQDEWRSSGWTGYNSDAGSGMFGSENTTGTGATAGGMTGGLATGATGMPLTGSSSGLGTGGGTTGSTGMTGSSGMESRERTETVQEEHIPIVEEQLRVGKREVNRGGARVRSYVREVPVHEQVSLREEHVSVERRPVNETLSGGQFGGADAFQERTIDMTETSEEAVVAKEAQVREELVVKKTAEERVENVDETVRRTEVDVDEGQSGSDNRSAFGSFGSGSSGTSGMDSDRERSDLERSDRDKSGF
nr:YsnF/AvaK domain-containing protein [uncultured Sphingosinicella sp.]